VLGIATGDLEVLQQNPTELPILRCVLPYAVRTKVSLVLTVHSRAGIPLASASAHLDVGERIVESSQLAAIAMDGYVHLNRAQQQTVEARVWSRRAFATIWTTCPPNRLHHSTASHPTRVSKCAFQDAVTTENAEHAEPAEPTISANSAVSALIVVTFETRSKIDSDW